MEGDWILFDLCTCNMPCPCEFAQAHMTVMVYLQLPVLPTRENILNLATRAEKEGFDSLWTITRILWPLNPQTPYVATPDGSLPSEYHNTLDPFDVLTYVAYITNKIALGTSVIDMFFYIPIMLALRLKLLKNRYQLVQDRMIILETMLWPILMVDKDQ